jgi:hypothetical protein
LNGSYQRTLADQVAKMVKRDLQGNYHVADTDSFLTNLKILPILCVDYGTTLVV